MTVLYDEAIDRPFDEPPESPAKPDWKVAFSRARSKFSQDGGTDAAAALTYYAMQSLFPGLIAVISLLNIFGNAIYTACTGVIVGFVTRGQGISVHRADCSNIAAQKEPERLVKVHWAPAQASVFLVEIQVEALDRNSLLSDVTRVLSESGVNILSAAVQTSRDRVAILRFTFEMGEVAHLSHVMQQVKRIESVFDCFRISGGSSK